jgi:hypothetical protein
MSRPKKHRPGTSWRTLAHHEADDGMRHTTIETASSDHPDRTVFDELVIDRWLHLEQMDVDTWWMRLGPLDISVQVGRNGEALYVGIEDDRNNQLDDCTVRCEVLDAEWTSEADPS